MAEQLTKEPVALTFEHIHALERLIGQSSPGALDLPHLLKARKTEKSLEFYHA